MLKIIFDNEDVYVSYGGGELLVQPLNTPWLQVIGCIENGEGIKIIDDRKELQDHQHNMSCKRGLKNTNYQMLNNLLAMYDPKERGILSADEHQLIQEILELTDRTVIELRNLRDFVVAHMGRSDDLIDWDRMSAITHCIDTELFKRGVEV